MSWQKCPKCDGSGNDGTSLMASHGCSICNGCGVINEQTGEPLRNTNVTTLNTAINVKIKDLFITRPCTCSASSQSTGGICSMCGGIR